MADGLISVQPHGYKTHSFPAPLLHFINLFFTAAELQPWLFKKSTLHSIVMSFLQCYNKTLSVPMFISMFCQDYWHDEWRMNLSMEKIISLSQKIQ